ncbi:hypothetical protein JHD50_12690 [Sulfurimonas sp. MAG313]|nr:hypothetical protein [Sulfurimonas sp. MAG313]MDF1882144.1 hypothetical protein [Sulfurimonas sp. MAG313]
MNLFLKSSLFILLFILSACTPKLGVQADASYTQAQLDERKTLNETYESLQHINNIDAALYLNSEDLSKTIEKEFESFTKRFIKLDAPGFSKASFGRINVILKGSGIYSKVDFSFEVDSLKRIIYGHLNAKHSIKAGKNTFIINTSFDDIVLDKIDQSQKLEENNENKELIASAVQSFLHILRIEIINLPLRLEVDMNSLQGINGKDIFSSNDYKLHTASAINMQTKMQTYFSYINEKGLILLGSSEFKEFNNYLEHIDLVELKSILDDEIDLMLTESMGVSLEVLQKYSSYYLSKSYLSQQMSKSLAKMDLRVINKFFLNIPKEEQKFQKSIYFFDKDNLPSCQGVTSKCSKLLHSCHLQCKVKFGIHECIQCDDINNPFGKVRCLSELEACKTKEDLNLYECNKKEDSCKVENIEIKTQCEVENLARISLCQEDKDALKFINDEILLTKLNFDFNIASSYAVQRIKSIQFSKDLNKVKINRDLHVSVNSNLSIDTLRTSVKDLRCVLAIKRPLRTHSQVDFINQVKEITLSIQRLENGNIELKAVSQPHTINVNMKINPYDKLMDDKPSHLNCYYKFMPMQAIASRSLLEKKDIPSQLQAILGYIEIKFDKEELSFLILPVKLNTNTIFYPTIENKAIIFSRQAHFY